MRSLDLPVVGTPTLRASRTRPAPVRTADQVVPAPRTAAVDLATVYLLVAAEWLISGLDKLVRADFAARLGRHLQITLADNPNRWYAHLLRRLVLPHASAVAVLVEWAELAVGVGLVLGAVRYLAGAHLRPQLGRLCDVALIGALVGSALLALTYWFLAGYLLPGVDAANAFEAGLSLAGLLALGSLALFVLQVRAVAAGRTARA